MLSLLKYQNICRNLTKVAIARNEYDDSVALISKQFNESVDLIQEELISRMSLLRVQRDEKLIAALGNFIKIVTPYLNENDLSILTGLGVNSSLIESDKKSFWLQMDP